VVQAEIAKKHFHFMVEISKLLFISSLMTTLTTNAKISNAELDG
jgi:hypothetical protein